MSALDASGALPLLLTLTALAGGLGAMLRYLVDVGVASWGERRGRRPQVSLGIVLVNLSGSFAMGLVTGWAAGAAPQGSLALILGVGLLGGYTTFSTASVDTLRLMLSGRPGAAAAHGLGQLCVSIALAAGGWWLGGALAG